MSRQCRGFVLGYILKAGRCKIHLVVGVLGVLQGCFMLCVGIRCKIHLLVGVLGVLQGVFWTMVPFSLQVVLGPKLREVAALAGEWQYGGRYSAWKHPYLCVAMNPNV